jgi:hypothetical protein
MNTSTIQLALISHTNIGKTTLARTLLGHDVGEVRDAPHVTTLNQAYPLLVTPQGDTLQLWDTPGFGDSVRLFKRISMSDNPISWFLREVFDRYRDRVFWLSQQAMRTARDSADVVLYLVNSSETPDDQAFLQPELKLLAWLGKPVLVLLNQSGEPKPADEATAEQARWRAYFERFPIVHGVLALDACARCWVHEHVLYEAIGKLLHDQHKEAYGRIRALWAQNNAQRFDKAIAAIGELLASAAKDSEVIEGEGKKFASSLASVASAVGIGRKSESQRQEKAIAALTTRLNLRIDDATTHLLQLHRLDPGEARKIKALLQEHFVILEPLDKTKAGLLGAVAAGATAGVSADLLAGGLTLGGGALLGGLFGGLAFVGAAWSANAYNDRHEPIVHFSNEALNEQLITSVLLYLTVAHFGRGRGSFTESDAPKFWRKTVESAVQLHADELDTQWAKFRGNKEIDFALARLNAVVLAITKRTLEQLYPAAKAISGYGAG